MVEYLSESVKLQIAGNEDQNYGFMHIFIHLFFFMSHLLAMVVKTGLDHCLTQMKHFWAVMFNYAFCTISRLEMKNGKIIEN